VAGFGKVCAITDGRNQQSYRWHSHFETWSGVFMFDGKNNRILDSFSFRLALTVAVFAAWSGAGYVLLYLA
jgi:hypothetical protein